jgi:hypothetical protein
MLFLFLNAALVLYSQEEANRLIELLSNTLNAAAEAGRASPANPSNPENPGFTVLNKTGYTVRNIFVCLADVKEWGANIFSGGRLYNGESARITLNTPLSTANRYNIRLVDEDGDCYSKYNVEITEFAVIVITISDFEF